MFEERDWDVLAVSDIRHLPKASICYVLVGWDLFSICEVAFDVQGFIREVCTHKMSDLQVLQLVTCIYQYML